MAADGSLLTLPDSWLQDLSYYLEEEDKLALFRTCKAMRDLIMHRYAELTYALPIPPAEAEIAEASLRLALRTAACVSLWFIRAGSDPLQPNDNARMAANVHASASRLMFSAMAAPNSSKIKIVRLQGLSLSALVPPWLSYTCPSMTGLTLDDCQFSLLPDPTASVPVCRQLTALCLIKAPVVTDLPFNLPFVLSPTTEQWQHQLRALPSLHTLDILPPVAGTHEGGWDEWAANARRFLKCCTVLGSQLEKLTYFTDEFLPAQLPAWFPLVSDMELANLSLVDADMEVLLNMPSLTSLECSGFKLDSDFSHRTSPIRRYVFRSLSVDSFARLPLAHAKWLQAADNSDALWVQPSNDLIMTERAVAAITASSKSGGADGIIWWSAGGHLSIGDNRMMADSACLSKLMPLFGHCRPGSISINHAAQITPELLAAIKQHVVSPEIYCIDFAHCTWSPAALPLLLPSLAPVPSINFVSADADAKLTEAQLQIICVHALHPVDMLLGPKVIAEWLPGWEERVQAAMTAAGHQHVKLRVVEPEPEAQVLAEVPVAPPVGAPVEAPEEAPGAAAMPVDMPAEADVPMEVAEGVAGEAPAAVAGAQPDV